MRLVFLPLSTVITDPQETTHGALTRAVARELAGLVTAASDVATVFRPFVSIVDGKRRFGVYGERWAREELARLFSDSPEADLVVHGDARFGDPFHLTIEVLRLPDLSPVAERSFEGPRFDGFGVVRDATAFILEVAGQPDATVGELPARNFDAWLDLARGRDAAAGVDGWSEIEDPAELFEPYLSALDREPGLAAAQDELCYFAVTAVGAGLVPQDAAVTAIKGVIAAAPKSRAAHTALARVYAATGDLSKSEDAFKKALELDPGRASLRYELGMVLLRQERFGRAGKVLETVKADPELGAEALFELGNIRAAKKDLEGAVELWSESLDRDPERSVVWASFARALISLGRFDEAEAAFEGGMSAEPPSPALHLVAGSYLAEQDQYKSAIGHLRKVLTMVGTEPLAHYSLGRCYEATGDRLRALHHLRKTMRAGGEIAALAREVVGSMRDLEREETLIRMVDEVLPRPAEEQVVLLSSLLKEENAYPEARMRLGVALLAVGKARAAEKQFRWVTKRLPEDAEGWSGLATALRARKKLKAAATAHLEAIERAPNHAAFRLNHADTLLRMGRVTEAAEEVDKARTLDPANPLLPGFIASVKLHLSQAE